MVHESLRDYSSYAGRQVMPEFHRTMQNFNNTAPNIPLVAYEKTKNLTEENLATTKKICEGGIVSLFLKAAIGLSPHGSALDNKLKSWQHSWQNYQLKKSIGLTSEDIDKIKEKPEQEYAALQEAIYYNIKHLKELNYNPDNIIASDYEYMEKNLEDMKTKVETIRKLRLL